MANALSDQERALIDAYWRAANYLSVGQIYLYDNPLLKKPLAKEHIKPRLLGHWGTTPRSELHLRPPEPGDQEARPGHDLHHRSRAWRARPGRERLPRGHLQRGLPERLPGRGGHEAPLHPVLVPRRHSEPRRAGARLDPRGRRARLRPLARLRRRFRQPRSDRRLRGRRRGGRDRAAGNELALQQVPEPGERRGGPADPAPQRLQDRQSLRPGPDQPRGAGPALPGLRIHAVFRRGHEPEAMHELMAATLDTIVGEIQRIKADALAMVSRSAPLADDRAPHAQGLDLPEGDRRQAHRGLLALAPGADGGDAREPGACAHPRGVDEELPARGAVRRERRATVRAGRPRACGHPPHERQPAHHGGVLLRDLRLPDFRDYAVEVPAPAPSRPSPPGSWAPSCGT